jgi:hypothetical protein
MTTTERRKMTSEIIGEVKKELEETMTMRQIKILFDVKTNQAIYKKIKNGMPAHKKKGTRYVFLKSEIINYLKS